MFFFSETLESNLASRRRLWLLLNNKRMNYVSFRIQSVTLLLSVGRPAESKTLFCSLPLKHIFSGFGGDWCRKDSPLPPRGTPIKKEGNNALPPCQNEKQTNHRYAGVGFLHAHTCFLVVFFVPGTMFYTPLSSSQQLQ